MHEIPEHNEERERERRFGPLLCMLPFPTGRRRLVAGHSISRVMLGARANFS